MLDKLEDPGAKTISIDMWNLLMEAKAGEEAQEDMQEMLKNSSSKVYSLWMVPKSVEVKVGHSPFVYMSKKRTEDPHHRCLVFFLSDRSDRGDPTAYAVYKDEAKEWGKWKQVDAASSPTDRMEFFANEDNMRKLFSPKQGQDIGPKDIPAVMIVGPKTAAYVLKERPSAAQL